MRNGVRVTDSADDTLAHRVLHMPDTMRRSVVNEILRDENVQRDPRFQQLLAEFDRQTADARALQAAHTVERVEIADALRDFYLRPLDHRPKARLLELALRYNPDLGEAQV